MVSQTRTTDNQEYGIETSYTDLGQPFIVTYPSGRKVRYAYDSLGRAKNIKTRDAGQSWEDVVTGVGYAPMGPIIGYNSFNGLRNVRALDSSYRLRAMRVQDDTNKLLHKTIKRDAAGRIIRINDQLDSENSARYAYTPDGRLRLAVGPWGDRRWWYDGVGNRKRERTVDDTGTKIERSVIPATSNQQPATSNQQPATRSASCVMKTEQSFAASDMTQMATCSGISAVMVASVRSMTPIIVFTV